MAAARAGDAGGGLRGRHLLHALQRRRARRPRDRLSVPVVGGGPARPLRAAFEAPPPVWERLAERRAADAGDRPVREPPAARRGGDADLRMGFCDRVVLPRWSRPEGAAREFERRHGRGPEATEVFGRPALATSSRCGRSWSRRRRTRRSGRGAAHPRALRPRLAHVQRRHLAGHQFWDLSQLDEASLGRGERRRSSVPSTTSTRRSTPRSGGCWRRFRRRGRDRHLGGRNGRQHEPRRPAARRCSPGCSPAARSTTAPGAISRLRAAMPGGLRAAIAGALPDRLALELTARLELRGIDWSTARAFAHPADNQGYVRHNLRGRERDGIVGPRRRRRWARRSPRGCAASPTPTGPGGRRGRPGARALPGRACRPPSRPGRPLGGPPRDAAAIGSFAALRRGSSATAGLRALGNHTPGDAWAVLAPGERHVRRAVAPGAAGRRRRDRLRAHRRRPRRPPRRAADASYRRLDSRSAATPAAVSACDATTSPPTASPSWRFAAAAAVLRSASAG